MKELAANAVEVLKRRYLAKDKNGKVVETVDEMWHRIADNIAKAEIPYFLIRGMAHEDVEDAYDDIRQQFYDMISDLDFLPNSPTIMNAGRPLGQLSACFVLPVEDSMEGIFNTIKNAALIHKSGGGTGFSFSRLRPEGSTVRSTGGVASGPISFMKAFDAATESVKQGGCFVAETLILTDMGPVQISSLKKGNKVLSVNVEDGTCEYVECTDPWLTKRDVEVWSISTDNGCSVVGTPDHPIMVSYYHGKNIRFKKICELEVGDAVVTQSTDGKPTYTTVIGVVKQQATRDVWNVEIPSNHNYFVCNNLRQGFFVSNTRRGANMGILRVDHPDIEKFIHCKDDTHILNNFNISVAVTDVFMKAVRDGTTYDLIDPHTKQVVKSLDAKTIFDEIVHSAWKTGEPGIFFIDRANATNTLKPIYGEIESTNPCVKGDTLVLTDQGEVEIQSVVDQYVNVWNGQKFIPVIPQVTGENQETIHVGVIDEHGTTRKIQCTLYHKFILKDGTRIEAKDLESGMELKPYRIPVDYAYDESIGSTIINEYLEINEPKVKYTRKGKILDKVYCFNEPELHQGIFNGILTGQCGEVPLLPYEACNLGSINLLNFVSTENDFGFDLDRLGDTVRLAVRFLDDVIDQNNYPLPEIDKMAHDTRRIGLGVMGWADSLYKLKVPYNSNRAVDLASAIMSFIHGIAHDESAKLADQRGMYPAYNKLKDAGVEVPFERNNEITCIAPTGTLSMIADVSSGIEPVFALGYYRNVMDNTKLAYINAVLREDIENRLDRSQYKTADEFNAAVDEKIDEVINAGTIMHTNFPDDMKNVYVTAHDIDPEWHIRMQAAFQQYTDNAISKTINFRHDATEDEVRTAYNLAYDLGCKGVTIYRDGCRENQVLNVGKVEDKKEEKAKIDYPDSVLDLPIEIRKKYAEQLMNQETVVIKACEDEDDDKAYNAAYRKMLHDNSYTILLQFDRISHFTPRERVDELQGFTRRVQIGCGKLYVTINHDEEGICEIFTSNGKGGGCPSQSEALARLASIALRSGVDIKEVIKQLRGIRCPSCQRNPNVKVLSCPDAVGRMLEEAQKRIDAEEEKTRTQETSILDSCITEVSSGDVTTNMVNYTTSSSNDSDLKFSKICPECGSMLEHEGGCVICRECGWSKCN